MNWDAVGAVAELLGAIGVIATLGYLAAQIRANSRSIQLQNTQSINAGTRAWWNEIATKPEIASLFRRGLASFDDLTPDERLQFSCFTLEWITMAEEVYFAEFNGEITGYAGHAYRSGGLEEFARTPGFQSWYEIRKPFITPEFQLVIEEAMKGGKPRADWYK